MTAARAGFPLPRNYSVDIDGNISGATPNGAPGATYDPAKYELPVFTAWLGIIVDGACKVYFTKADFDANKNYLPVSDSFSGPLSVRNVWVRAGSGTVNVTLVPLSRTS